jgi:hypothetical protein
MPKFDKEYQGYLRGECENYNQSLISALEEMEKGDETGMEEFNERDELDDDDYSIEDLF